MVGRWEGSQKVLSSKKNQPGLSSTTGGFIGRFWCECGGCSFYTFLAFAVGFLVLSRFSAGSWTLRALGCGLVKLLLMHSC